MCCQHYKEELRIHRESVLGETSRSTDKKKVITLIYIRQSFRLVIVIYRRRRNVRVLGLVPGVG